MRKGRDHNDHNNDHTAITQHPPCHSEHLLAWGLWVLQRDNKGCGKDGDDGHNHNEDGKGDGTTAGHEGMTRGHEGMTTTATASEEP